MFLGPRDPNILDPYMAVGLKRNMMYLSVKCSQKLLWFLLRSRWPQFLSMCSALQLYQFGDETPNTKTEHWCSKFAYFWQLTPFVVLSLARCALQGWDNAWPLGQTGPWLVFGAGGGLAKSASLDDNSNWVPSQVPQPTCYWKFQSVGKSDYWVPN